VRVNREHAEVERFDKAGKVVAKVDPEVEHEAAPTPSGTAAPLTPKA
jgi:hypothetical protein